MSSENVIRLDFRSKGVVEDERAMLACKTCRNKTFKLTYENPKNFPLLQCAACDEEIGRMGWWHDE
jgi:hypothetical protein